MNQFPSKNYFTLPNEIFSLGQYVDALSEKGLISTEPTSVLTKSRIKKNGNLCYTIRPIHEAVEIFHTRQLSAVERTTERRQIHRKLSAVNLLPGA